MPLVTLVRGRVRPGPHIFIAIPTHGEISGPTFASFFEGSQMLDAAGYGITLCVETGNCHVDDARNSLVREFLKTDCTDLVFIDADVGFRPEDLLKLVSADRDVVAGIYPKKDDTEDFPVLALPGELWADSDGLIEVEGVPTGFLRIRRHVLEKLAAKAVSFIGQAGDPIPYSVVFERRVEGGRRWSGDYTFCRKWREIGGRIYIDPEMHFSHTGAKAWSGSLGAFWKRKHGVEAAETAAAFDEAVAALKSGTATAEHFHALHKGWNNPWAASPELLAHMWALCDGSVLECGSGLSTLVLASKCKVTSLEHDPAHASFINGMLAKHGLSADVRCKPLKDGWYDFDGGAFDALVIDGPPRGLSDRSVALDRCTAPLVIWDDYEAGLDGAEIIEAEGKRFAIQRELETA